MQNIKNLYEKVYFYLYVLLTFSLPFSHAGISFATLLLALTWVVEGNFYRKLYLLFSTPVTRYLFLYLGFLILSMLWTQNIPHGLEILRLYSYWLLIPIMVTSLEKKYINTLISLFLIAMFVSEILFFGVFFDIWSIKGHTSSNPSSFMNHSVYSIYLAVTAILLLNRIFSKAYAFSSKFLMALFFISVTSNLLLAGGRTGQVGFLVALIIVTLFHFRHSLFKIFLIFFSATILTILSYWFVETFQTRVDAAASDMINVLNNGNYYSSVGLRISYWLAAKDIILEHPILGVGIGDVGDKRYEAYLDNSYNFSQKVIEFSKTNNFHNQYAEILVGTGLVGLVLFLLFIYEFYRLKIPDKEYKQLSQLFMTIYLVGALVGSLFIRQFPMVFFVYFTAIFIHIALVQEEKMR